MLASDRAICLPPNQPPVLAEDTTLMEVQGKGWKEQSFVRRTLVIRFRLVIVLKEPSLLASADDL